MENFMKASSDDPEKSVWYADHKDDGEDVYIDEVVEDDFLRLRASHHIVDKKRTVVGSLLLTPVQVIFEIVTDDPLDLLEPEQFQVVLLTKYVNEFILNDESNNKELFSKGHCFPLKIKMCSEDQYSTKHQLSSYGSTNILNEYLFFINSQWFSHLKHFLMSWFRENIKDMSTIVDDEDPAADLQDGEEVEETDYKSTILSDFQRNSLEMYFPARCTQHSWYLVFSTCYHGFSLTSLYRKCQRYEGPSLLVIESQNQETFGAFLSCVPHVCAEFTGTGESWLFSFKHDDRLQIYNWKGENNYFFKGNLASMVIGSDENGFGLWMDETLYKGRSQPVKTFNSPSLSSVNDFLINNLELWTFTQ